MTISANTNGVVGRIDGIGLDRDFHHTGRLAVDLALTGGEGPQFAALERLPNAQDLNVWLAWSQLEVVAPMATAGDHTDARRLRWAIWNALQAALTGTGTHARDRAVLDELAFRPSLVPQLEGEKWVDPLVSEALATIARDAIDLLRDPFLRGRIRTCESPDCGVPFVDVSRPGRRRWCEDARCGDRARQRAMRARRRAAKQASAAERSPT